MTLKYGVIALARTTFDMEFAEETRNKAFVALGDAGIEAVGPRTLACDNEQAEAARTVIAQHGDIDLLLILQITFTDATVATDIARHSEVPVAIWGVPEPRIGGRLRLNAFCGLNLAAHALGKAGVSHGSLFAATDAPDIAENLRVLAAPKQSVQSNAANVEPFEDTEAERALTSLRGANISVLGQHPDGFDTCSYDEKELADLAGITVSTSTLDTLFDRARSIKPERVANARAGVDETLVGLDAVDQEQLDRSLRLYCALEDHREASDARSLAVRCWPETFTEYGCAACGPMAMMNQKCVPSACEADVYGSFSALLLQELAQEPTWMADLVDLNFDDDTGVLWHCGLAPLSMCDPEAKPEATIHTNRKMPLLHQFPLKPGKFTIARLSQSRNETKLVIGLAEFIRAPMAFTGTSGVMKFEVSAKRIFDLIVDEGLEHHYALAYGDYRRSLRAIAAMLDLPLLELS